MVAAADIVPNMVVAKYDSGAHLSIRVSGMLWRGCQSKVSAWGRPPAGMGVGPCGGAGRRGTGPWGGGGAEGMVRNNAMAEVWSPTWARAR